MPAPTTGILTEMRTAMWNAVDNCEPLARAFVKKYRDDRDIQGLLQQGLSPSDLPSVLIVGTEFTSEMQTYSLEGWPVPYRIDLYMPLDRWSLAEMRIEQVIWAIRNQTPGGDSTVPYTRALCTDIPKVMGVSVRPAALQQAAPLAAAVNQVNAQQQHRCIVASATMLLVSYRNPYA